MEILLLGFFLGFSLIFVIGAQNIFVIEQGLKKQHIFLVCFICSISDLILIFLGIFLFHYFFVLFNSIIELLLNILLISFLLHFIYLKIKAFNIKIDFCDQPKYLSKYSVTIKTLGFTYLNPHVYSDTVLILGNFSKNLMLNEKILFGIGGSIASFLFFFLIGYLAKIFSKYAENKKVWKIINLFLIIFMSFFIFLVFLQIINLSIHIF